MLRYDLPLTEMVFGFYDRMKSVSRGYASLDYEPKDYRAADLVRMDLMVNGDRVDSLSLIVHRRVLQQGPRPVREDEGAHPSAAVRGRDSGGHRLAGDRPDDRQGPAQERDRQVLRRRHHRKRKLLERQKEGKKRMKQVGNVEIPQEAFLAILKVD
jgi:GTP-binding protein LepA